MRPLNAKDKKKHNSYIEEEPCANIIAMIYEINVELMREVKITDGIMRTIEEFLTYQRIHHDEMKSQ